MGIVISNKELSAAGIECGGTFNVRLSLAAEPNIVSNPADMVLILDRSGSMENSIDELKLGARRFVEIIDESTDGAADGNIGGGSRIGIVSFSGTASQDTQLITSVEDLNQAIDALAADGFTNHEDAFSKALQLFEAASDNAKVMIMFTDGVTTAGGDADTIAAAAKAIGVTIYVIGLLGNGGIDEDALREWASDPDSAYVAIAPDASELEELFEDLARNITNPGATNIVINERISDCFRITSISAPTKGMASLVDSNSVRWTIDELGVNASEGASLEFAVEHLGGCSGETEVNESIDYDDSEGNVVSFPSPVIDVDCGINVIPEVCPDPVAITVGGCEDSIEFDAGDIQLSSTGCILQLSVTLNSVCPDRRVALAVILTEVDEEDNEYQRGLKTITVPAHNAAGCRDVTVRCVKFVLPQDLDVSGGAQGICGERNFRARFIAHYIDNDFECCE